MTDNNSAQHIQFAPHIDGHVHVFNKDQARTFPDLMDRTNATRVGLACQSDLSNTNDNIAGFYLKESCPDRFYMFAGLDHSGFLFDDCHGPVLREQAQTLHAAGVDGIKLLAGKPNSRKRLGTPMDGPYFEEFFNVCEELDIPLLWHVADPEEFWDPSQLPQWAQDQGWGYDSSFPAKEELYSEVENVLSRHKSLRVIFAHLYFLSADLERAEKFLTDFPAVNLDLAPGIELYYNLSAQWEKAREFFIKFKERIFFGTDIMSMMTPVEVCARAGIVYRFLVDDKIFRVSEDVDFLLGHSDDGIIRGLDLPDDAIDCILNKNFIRMYGASPGVLDPEIVKIECKRLEELEEKLKT